MRTNIILIILGAIIGLLIFKKCDSKPRVVTETITKTVIKFDTIIETKIIKGDVVNVEKIKTIKGKDSIIYKDIPSETTTSATQFKTKIQSNKAIANLLITSTGEVLDVQGVITYPELETITRVTKTRDASGLFIYGSTSVDNFNSPEVGLMYQFKNKVGVIAGINYNITTQEPIFRLGFLIKL